jgi:AAA+ ATPase superfamily predicted ATPase
MLYNPFQPNKIVGPAMFAGRANELASIEKCIFQAKHGNPQNFLISGERGIGKSSLLLFVEMVASGRIEASQDIKFKFITISVDLGSCQTEVDIIRTIARGLRLTIADQESTKDATKKFLNFLSNWEVLGVKYNKQDSDADPEDLCEILVNEVAVFCKTLQGDIDGILLLLDEADQPSSAANLEKFAKYFTERLTKKDCNNLLLGMAGLPHILTRLRDSHESSPRLFEIFHLQPLEIKERKYVVETGLKLAAAKNQLVTGITTEAMEQIAVLSEGYPHFVQQFAHSAFDNDTDNNIDLEDVLSGAHKENGAIAQLGQKYFSEMYFDKIGSDDYRIVLNTMAEHTDNWISRKEIIRESRLKDSTVSNALNALKARNIIFVDDAKQGNYRLPTKSFAAWINAIKSVSEKSPDGQAALDLGFNQD